MRTVAVPEGVFGSGTHAALRRALVVQRIGRKIADLVIEVRFFAGAQERRGIISVEKNGGLGYNRN